MSILWKTEGKCSLLDNGAGEAQLLHPSELIAKSSGPPRERRRSEPRINNKTGRGDQDRADSQDRSRQRPRLCLAGYEALEISMIPIRVALVPSLLAGQVVQVVGPWGSQPSRQPCPRTTQPTARPIEMGSASCFCCFMLPLALLHERDMVTEPSPSSLHPRPGPRSTATAWTYAGHQDGRHRYISWLCLQVDHQLALVVSILSIALTIQPSPYFCSLTSRCPISFSVCKPRLSLLDTL